MPSEENKLIGLYLHIPFCKQKCGYCDFASYAGREDAFLPVADAMKAEMRRAEGLSVRSIYVGGGTPTCLPVGLLAELLHTAAQCFAVTRDAEITVEANPGTVDAHALESLREAGVNRLSIGAQASQPHLLSALGRIHSWEDVSSAVSLARGTGFENISLDLMAGLPGQTPMDFRDTLDAALDLSPTHLSIYGLIIEEGTPFFERYTGRPEMLPDDAALEKMADDARWMLEDAGLSRYEISNYAREGRECRHNMGYWLREDYLGIGCAAHSLIGNHRFAGARTIEGYLRGELSEKQTITEDEALFERLMLGLRLVEGIPWGGRALFDRYAQRLKKLRERGLLEYNEERLWLTARGLDLQNRVLVELMD